MRDQHALAASMKSLLLRPAQAVAVVFALTLVLALAALALAAWLDVQRIESVRARVNRTQLLQESQRLLEEQQMRIATGSVTVDPQPLERIRALLDELPRRGGPIGPITSQRLVELDALLTRAASAPREALADAGDLLNKMLQRETLVQSELLDSVSRDTVVEWRLALAALVVFPCLIALALWALRQRVFRPIGDLRLFLSRLAEGDFVPASLERIDPLLRPLFENYNRMLNRLEQLEQANRKRTLSLEQEVRTATQALLRQQQSLARAERLAAAGEVSAALAHELRNPLAGMHVTLANLRNEVADPDIAERLDLVSSELQRVTRLLNGLLQQSNHMPEPPREVDVARLLRELCALLRYQIPSHIELVPRVEERLHCRLPEDGVRQAILNLVLNSVAALGDRAGTIAIEARRRDGLLQLEVSDDGPGFPAELLSTGIRPFRTFRESGTGLGLAIVNRFARDLGGELKIANRSPRGTCVTITLSCNERDAAPDRR
jgi:C4-dicarboxylate-specific signal transduction histidine kinase